MAYKQQPMDFKWQVARKIDRLDLGNFAAIEFFYRNAIIYGLIRGIDPEEPEKDDEDDKKRKATPIPALMESIDKRINDLQGYDTTAMILGKSQLPEVQAFQRKTMSVWYAIAEVTTRCKITDNVRVEEERFG